MIKFIATVTNPGEPSSKMLGLGLSEGNVLKLKQGLPIVIDLRDVGITAGPLRFVSVFYGGKFSQQRKSHEG